MPVPSFPRWAGIGTAGPSVGFTWAAPTWGPSPAQPSSASGSRLQCLIKPCELEEWEEQLVQTGQALTLGPLTPQS